METARSARKRETTENVSLSDFEEVFSASAARRIDLIREGVPARDVKRLQELLGMPQGIFLGSLRLSTATLNRKASRHEHLSPEDSENVVGVAKLIGQVEEMVRQSGDMKDFDAPRWLAAWLQQAVPALGGARPIDLLDTLEGQAMISRLLSQIESGAYA